MAIQAKVIYERRALSITRGDNHGSSHTRYPEKTTRHAANGVCDKICMRDDLEATYIVSLRKRFKQCNGPGFRRSGVRFPLTLYLQKTSYYKHECHSSLTHLRSQTHAHERTHGTNAEITIIMRQHVIERQQY